MIFLFFFSHLDEGLIERVDWWGWTLLVVPLAWGLHFAGKRYDGHMKRRRR